MTAQRVPQQLYYTPREAGIRLDPPRSGQWVRVRIHRGEIHADQTPSGDFVIPHDELRRLTGQDLTVPGHETVRDERDEKLRELNVRLSKLGAELAQCVALAAELG